jgi:hypothetical protein
MLELDQHGDGYPNTAGYGGYHFPTHEDGAIT